MRRSILEELRYLYHYTSIETLALILKNKTIRFSSLSRVDDVEEEATADYGNLGRFTFVSCWTNDLEESIPLWNLYTPNMTGVRIIASSVQAPRYGVRPHSKKFH